MDRIKQAQRTISLLNSMIASGENHTTVSHDMTKDALAGLEQLRTEELGEQRELLINFAKFIQKYKTVGLDYNCVEREVDDFLNQ